MRFTKDATFAELIAQCPECGDVLMEYGLHCIGCHLSPMESIEEGAKAHGLTGAQVDKLIRELNEKLKEKR